MHILGGPDGSRHTKQETDSGTSHFPPGFEEGLEVALTWLDQWSRTPNLDSAVEGLGLSVRHILRCELFVVIVPAGAQAAIWYPRFGDDASSDPELVKELCAVRFTHSWQRAEGCAKPSRVLAGAHVESLVAVPFFRAGRPMGCVAAVNKQRGGYTKSDRWLLALAASILSVGDRF